MSMPGSDPRCDIFDLTLPIHEGISVEEGDPPVTLARARSHDADGYEVTRICLGSHSGTHVDAPRHFFADGATLDSYPLQPLMGPGLVIDARPESTKNGADSTRITSDLLRERLAPFPSPCGGRLLLWTEGALLTSDTAEVLLATGAVLVGTDAPSLDPEPYPVHRSLLRRGVLIAENLHGLDALGQGPIGCAFLPLLVVGTDGAPVRAIAWRPPRG